MLIVTVTGLLETFGFMARIMMLHKPDRTTFIIQQCFLIISPVLLAIVVYMVLGMLIQRSAAGVKISQSWWARWLSKLYTASDIFCLLLQSTGGAMLAGDDASSIKTGTNIMLAGLALQLGFFTTFTLLVIYTHSSPQFGLGSDPTLRKVYICLYSTITLMFIRNIFRVVEFAQGWDGYLASHEAFFYGLDFVPIFFCFVFFSVFHFGFYLGPGAAAPTSITAAISMSEYAASAAKLAQPASSTSSNSTRLAEVV